MPQNHTAVFDHQTVCLLEQSQQASRLASVMAIALQFGDPQPLFGNAPLGFSYMAGRLFKVLYLKRLHRPDDTWGYAALMVAKAR